MTSSRVSPTFIMVPCRCGRLLRAKWEQVGTEIQCWDCQMTTMVVIPRQRLRLLDLISRNVTDLLRREGSWQLVVLAGVAVLAMSIAYVGMALGALVLFAAAALYGDVIRYPDRPDARYRVDRTRVLRGLTPKRIIACALLVAGLVGPLWLVHVGVRRSPHFDPISFAVFVLGAIVGPLAMVAAYSDFDGEGAKLRHRLDFVRKYPLITIAVLAIIPLSLVTAELIITGILYGREMIPMFVLDFMPAPGKPLRVIEGFVFYDGVNFMDLPQERFVRGYGAALKRGYSFVGVIPPSLSLPSRSGVSVVSVRQSLEQYYQFRQFLTFLVCVALIVGYAIQARCLSILSCVNRQPLG